ncbi:unnamed protein product [Leptidea sinapis]|uniref:Uncharacterized protein n=1 Tax=Leptidea sinapis TaxID=189913 RepID=A0A5E4R3F3_9NEOP|nr:unnamed protein product [Leptidea sinapis]
MKSSILKIPECHACFASDLEAVHKIRTGSTFYLECRCDDPTSSRISLKWLDTHDKEIQPSGPGTKSNVYTEWWDEITYSLYITNISKSISGTYKCVTEYNGREYSRSYTLEAYDLPYFVNTDATQYVVSGSDALINCKARGETDPLISWHKDHDEPIEVLVPPVILEFDNITATEGSTVQIACKARGLPTPKINLLYLGEEPEDQRIVWSSNNTSEIETEFYLTFLQVNRSHEGSYICNATNDVESVYSEMFMTVYYKPYFNKPIENIWGWSGNPVNLTCDYESNPPSNISWRLIVENENKVPVEVDDTIQYGIYECTAGNDYGEAKKIIVFLEGFAPPPVRNVTVLNVTATSATFNIDGPEEITGPPIVGFTSEYDVAENFDVTNIHINRTWSLDRPYRINKLRPNSSYFIRFAAVNDVGGGAWSDFIEFVTLEK